MSQKPPRLLLRSGDQLVVGGLGMVGLCAFVLYWSLQGGWQGRSIEIDRAKPRTATFHVDINQAEWPELVQLPNIGETLARRIVDSRAAEGPFLDHHDLLRVSGIGPRTLEQIEPYLRPMPPANSIVER